MSDQQDRLIAEIQHSERSPKDMTCAECGAAFHYEGGTDWKMDIKADTICERCADNAVQLSINKSRMTDKYCGYFGIRSPDPLAKNAEEHSTGYYEVRGAALARALLLARLIYGQDVVIIED